MVKIIETLIPAYSNARPCTKRRKFSGVTIHETGNYNNGSGAKNHSLYKTVNGGWNAEESYHYVVDSIEAYRLVPESEITWHAGDGGNGVGNNETISIEICVNPDSNFGVACNNAAEITADILKRNNITTAAGWVHQHNNWSGKNCPKDIRATGKWNEFLSKVQQLLNGTSLPSTPAPDSGILYRVRKSWAESASQLGAYKSLDSAKALADKNPGYEVYDPNGNQVYPSIQAPAAKMYVNLFAVRDTWAVYPLGVSRTPGNVKGYLAPKREGGLSYTVISSLGGSAFTIKTQSFGEVQIYCPNDSEGNTATSPRYTLCDPGAPVTPPPAQTGDVELSRVKKSGRATMKESVFFRDKPSTDYDNIQGSYYAGESVNYDLVVESTKYTWISWIGGSGARRYMPVVDKSNGERWSNY